MGLLENWEEKQGWCVGRIVIWIPEMDSFFRENRSRSASMFVGVLMKEGAVLLYTRFSSKSYRKKVRLHVSSYILSLPKKDYQRT